ERVVRSATAHGTDARSPGRRRRRRAGHAGSAGPRRSSGEAVSELSPAAGTGPSAAWREGEGRSGAAPRGRPEGANDRPGPLPSGDAVSGGGGAAGGGAGRGGRGEDGSGGAGAQGDRPVPAGALAQAGSLLGPPPARLLLPGPGTGGRGGRGIERLRGAAAQVSLGLQR